MAGRVWMKGSANAARIAEAVTTPVQAKKRGDRAQNRHCGAPGGERAGHTVRGTSKGCQGIPKRLSALRSLMRMREGK